MRLAMKPLAGTLAILLALAGCKSSSGNAAADNANAIFKAPVASTGSGIDPETQGPISADTNEVKAPRPEILVPGMAVKEITVDPKDARTRIDLVRTLLGEDWMLMSRTPKGDGIIVYKFMRRDVARVDVDPFGIPDIHKATKEPAKPIPAK
jgi:hypothetical protein